MVKAKKWVPTHCSVVSGIIRNVFLDEMHPNQFRDLKALLDVADVNCKQARDKKSDRPRQSRIGPRTHSHRYYPAV